MKPILVATDYSPVANHAVDYAAQLAHSINAQLMILHVWMIPSFGGEVPVVYPIAELEEANQKRIDDEAERIRKKWDVKVKTFQTIGIVGEEIESYSSVCNAGLVVMGTRHAGPILQAFGSVATDFIKRDKFPVLLVPEKTEFVMPKKILLATDVTTKSNWRELDLLKEVATLFNSEIHIVNAVSDEMEKEVSWGPYSAGHRLEKKLENYPHHWHYVDDEDAVHGINKIANEVKADWIAAIPHHTNWFRRLMEKSTTKQLVFDVNSPLLILPEHHLEL